MPEPTIINKVNVCTKEDIDLINFWGEKFVKELKATHPDRLDDEDFVMGLLNRFDHKLKGMVQEHIIDTLKDHILFLLKLPPFN